MFSRCEMSCAPPEVGDPLGPDLDLAELLSVLEAHGVEFIVVGGVAANVDGSDRPTRDLDVCPRWSDGNLDRLARALRSVGARLRIEGSPAPIEFPIDVAALRMFELSTWRTLYGDIDVIQPDIDALPELRRLAED